ncbi:ABC transporter ATP-binding protein [Aciduricibacillus chroicocephali]|uniref:ABC transporter ATP-binding protein n=1 Tax=Aciduricibacillus chroicocephali TaxID=3054939 RepID=A0ABY9KWU1_9BACI|nr:ABC transporter ATP-binding protein [Bacillaceae bacterium 44XB]
MYVQISDLAFSHHGSKEMTIEKFNLDIERGEIISILGESGCGKSTLLRLLAGLEMPQSGRIVIGGKTIVDNSHFVMPEKRGVGMVFQDYALFPHMTVEENIRFGLKKMKSGDKRQRVKEVLELVRMERFKKRYPHELSGGQQQRIALARAIAPEPSLLLLDEPFSNLDADLQIKIRNELREIIKKAGTTTIFVTHDYKDSIAMADRIFTMRHGAPHVWDSLCTAEEIAAPAEQQEHQLRPILQTTEK